MMHHLLGALFSGITGGTTTAWFFHRKTPLLSWVLVAIANASATANDILFVPWLAPLNAACLLYALYRIWRGTRDKRKRALGLLGAKSRALRDRLAGSMPRLGARPAWEGAR